MINNNNYEKDKQLHELSTLFNVTHITMDELDQYVEGVPSVAFRVENHIQECNFCNAMIETLAEYRYGMTMKELKALRSLNSKEPAIDWGIVVEEINNTLTALKKVFIQTPILVAIPARAATSSRWEDFVDSKNGIKYSKREISDGSMEIKILIDDGKKPKMKMQWGDCSKDVPITEGAISGFIGEVSLTKEERAIEKKGATINFILENDN